MKNIFFILLLFISIISISQNNSDNSLLIPSSKPKLVVGIVVEQMRQDYLDKFWDKFSDKGFKKLVINGTNCKNAFLNYSLTQTSPGYATIITGAEPAAHGIVTDYWFNHLTGKKEISIEDNAQEIIGTKKDKSGFSPKNLLSTTFSDETKIFYANKSKVFSLSLSKYAAILSGGFAADAAVWFDNVSGNWVTSSYYTKKLPKWIEDQNDKKMPEEYLTRIWTPTFPIQDIKKFDYDTNIYKIGIDGVYKTFPYNYSEMKKFIINYELLEMIPEGNTHLTDLAVAALYNENLGKDDFTDFLFVNYSVSENIGRLFGPQSAEVLDLYLRLDQNIAHLIEVIEEVVGKNNVLIYLTSNHGISEIPQFSMDNKLPTGIYKQHYIVALLKSYLKSIYGEGEWILDYNNSQLYLNKTLIEDSGIALGAFQEKIISFIINSNGITNAISSTQFQNMIFMSGMPQKMQNSYNQKRSGDIMISLKPGWIEDLPFATNHNSGYSYDTHVPLIWYGWKIKKQTIYTKINITDIAPTISNILNTPPPPLTTGKILEEITISK
ncbi:MAG: alkaline phosphatase family protein [Bacteroidales bacterium]|jgi:predicted AlkP superfamily pyrophosphatase or phosphodiesterase|nr:alkaline phosphatase family protein [Bacteroidales bacterium]